MSDEFLHHGNTSLGEHILSDTALTYVLARNSGKGDINVALKIAMLHDLYELPWQNNPEAEVDRFLNNHGFRHPIEAVVNACTWYPFVFEDKDEAEKVIDGVVHHMFPFPVVRFNDSSVNEVELKNFGRLLVMDKELREVLERSSNRGGIGRLSIARSRFIEGRFVCLADKIASIGDLKRVSDVTALVTGKNRNLGR